MGSFWNTVADPRAVASYRLSIGCSLIAATINAVFGFLVAWVLVRYRFAGRKFLDAMVDLPFALPTAVSGIALTRYAQNGWIGRYLEPLGIQVAYTWLGIVVAADLHRPAVRRSHTPAGSRRPRRGIGRSRRQPGGKPLANLLAGHLARHLAVAFDWLYGPGPGGSGEYGSVVFIAGNMPMKTEITPLLIVIKLEQYDYAGATAIAVVILTMSFLMLLAINLLQRWSRKQYAEVV